MKNQTVQTVVFDSVAPYPEPVQISELLADIEAVIRRHVILKDQAAAALAVWVLHTYTFELRDTVAYVAIESPEKRCGKTTLLSVLAAMAHKPLIASNVTVGALFRAIDTCRPALFIDEADTFLAGNGTMRGIVNSGNTWRTAYVLRLGRSKQHRALGGGTPGEGTGPTVLGSGRNRALMAEVPTLEGGEATHRQDACATRVGEGGETGLKWYSCWCPKVIAMIGRVPDTIADRSIVVRMSRKLVSEMCAPLAELNATEIRAKCVRFALDAGPAISKAAKVRVEGLNDRAADTFDPLYVIARLAGNGWMEKLHAAALELSAVAQSDQGGGGTEILLDVFSVLIEYGGEKIFSRDLAAILRGDYGGMTQALKYSTINEHRVAHMLRPYGIKPVVLRVGKEVNRGYAIDDFYEALRRYVPEADVRARLEELNRHGELRTEAKAEAEKEEAMMQEQLAQEAKEQEQEMAETMPVTVPTMPKMAALVRKLKKEIKEMEDEAEL